MLTPISNLVPTLNSKESNPLSSLISTLGNQASQGGQANQAKSPLVNTSSLNIQQYSNTELFNAVLDKAYQRMTENLQFNQQSTPVSDYNLQSADKISADQAASNVLGFIQQRIATDKANGASADELNQRLDQALSGFKKGFNEAKDILEGLGLLKGPLAEEIGDTYQKVTNGIDVLREGVNQPVNTNPQNQTNPGNQTSAVNRVAYAEQVSQSRSFSLELTTQDGDTVTVEIARERQASRAISYGQSGEETNLQASRTFSAASAFEIKVEGELDDEELAAINQLLSDVGSIAQDFYSGKLDKAFQSALDISFNSEELASLNLELQQTKSVNAIAAYQSNSGAPAQAEIAGIGQLFQQVNELLEKAQTFAEPLKLIDKITEGLNQLNAEPSPRSENAASQAQALQEAQFNEFRNALISMLEKFFS